MKLLTNNHFGRSCLLRFFARQQCIAVKCVKNCVKSFWLKFEMAVLEQRTPFLPWQTVYVVTSRHAIVYIGAQSTEMTLLTNNHFGLSCQFNCFFRWTTARMVNGRHFYLQYTLMLNCVPTCAWVSPDPENKSIAVGSLLPYCIRAEIYVISYQLPFNSRHLWFPTYLGIGQHLHLCLQVARLRYDEFIAVGLSLLSLSNVRYV